MVRSELREKLLAGETIQIEHWSFWWIGNQGYMTCGYEECCWCDYDTIDELLDGFAFYSDWYKDDET